MNKPALLLAVVALLTSTIVLADDGRLIRCTLDGRDGTHHAGETSTLARGVDLTAERGYDFFAYVGERTDRRVFKVEAYEAGTDRLVAARSVSYFAAPDASLSIAAGELVFTCEMHR